MPVYDECIMFRCINNDYILSKTLNMSSDIHVLSRFPFVFCYLYEIHLSIFLTNNFPGICLPSNTLYKISLPCLQFPILAQTIKHWQIVELSIFSGGK